MAAEIEIPAQLPVMTLSNTVFFPHVMLPLYIFEARYRQMLAETLEADRLFVVAREDVVRGETTGEFEPPFPIGAVGVIRACHQENDGTSHLILQGLARVRFTRIIREEPYRLAEFQILESKPGTPDDLGSMRRELINAVRSRLEFNQDPESKMLDYLESQEDHEAFLDLASFTLCEDNDTKQELLETLNVVNRSRRLLRYLQRQINQLKLEKQLRGDLHKQDLDRN